MAKTQWYPHSRVPGKWLLADGTVLSEPEFEASESKRRFRIKSETVTSPSCGRNQIEETALRWVEEQSKALDQRIVAAIPVDDREFYIEAMEMLGRINSRRAMNNEAPPDLFFLNVTSSEMRAYGTEVSTAWWLLKSRDGVQFLAYSRMTRRASYDYRTDTNRLEYTVETGSIGYRLDADRQNRFMHHMDALDESSIRVGPDGGRMSMFDHSDRNVDMFTRRKVIFSGDQATDQAVDHFIQTIARINARDKMGRLAIPLRRDDPPPADTSHLDLTVAKSNVSKELIDSMIGTAPVLPDLREAKKHYEEMAKAMGRAGIPMGDLQDNVFMALLSGSTDLLRVPLRVAQKKHAKATHRAKDGFDELTERSGHQLYLDLLFGNFYTECDTEAFTPELGEEIAERWSEAQAIASITGNSDLLDQFKQAALAQKAEESVRESTATNRRRRTKIINSLKFK